MYSDGEAIAKSSCAFLTGVSVKSCGTGTSFGTNESIVESCDALKIGEDCATGCASAMNCALVSL